MKHFNQSEIILKQKKFTKIVNRFVIFTKSCQNFQCKRHKEHLHREGTYFPAYPMSSTSGKGLVPSSAMDFHAYASSALDKGRGSITATIWRWKQMLLKQPSLSHLWYTAEPTVNGESFFIPWHVDYMIK
jgi:hypothetical protein